MVSIPRKILSKEKVSKLIKQCVTLPSQNSIKYLTEQIRYTCKNTEELGILVEKAMCNIMNTPFNTKRRYNHLPKNVFNDINETIGDMLRSTTMTHVGNLNMKYDFINDNKKTFSVKTIMSGNKVCPQNIGQCSFKSFNLKTGLDLSSKVDFKMYFMKNKEIMLQKYLDNCFCCDTMIIYKFESGLIYIINNENKSEFVKNLEFTTSRELDDWNESNTVYVKCNELRLSLGEIQIHNNRDCIKFRFNIDSVIHMINNNYINNLSIDVYNLKTKYFFKIGNKKE